jgi:hypothetical protein
MEELKEANSKVEAAKAGASRMMMLTVLLAGALIAVAAFLAITISGQRKAIDDAVAVEHKKVVAAEEALGPAKESAAQMKAAIDALKLSYARFEELVTVDNQVNKKVDAINAKVPENLRAAAKAAIPYREGWIALEKYSWTPAYDGAGEWRTYANTNLVKRLGFLEELDKRLTGWDGKPPAPKVCPVTGCP